MNSVFERGDILFGKLRPNLQKCEQMDFPGYCSTELLVLRARSGVDARFAAKVLQSDQVFDEAVRSAEGTRMPRTSWKKLRAFRIPWIPPSDQRRIADILDATDEAIRSTGQIIAKLEEIRAGVLAGVLGGPHRRSTLGGFISYGPQNGLYKPASDYHPEGTPIVRIDSFDGGEFHPLGRLKRLSVTGSELKRYGLAADDILINRVNTVDLVGKCAIVPRLSESTVFESNIMRIKMCPSELLPQFAVLWLSSHEAKVHFRKSAKSAISQASINQVDVRSCPVVAPSAEEQERILAVTASLRERIAATGDEIDKLRLVKQGLMDDLLTGRVRVSVAGHG